MMSKSWVFKIILVLIIIYAVGGCGDFDYFTEYDDVNLIGHTLLSDWATTQNTTYMTYESVASATAGTSGLPDSSALIYRLEINNLVPDGDFEVGPDLATSGWTAVLTTGTALLDSGPHELDGNAIYFDLSNTEYIEYDLSQMADGPVDDSLYVFRFSLQGSATGNYYFEISETSTPIINQFTPYIPNSGTNEQLAVPFDFNELTTPEFLIYDWENQVFRINFETDGKVQEGYFDNFRIVKSDQTHYLQTELTVYDSNRTDELPLISGTYRFSVYVKADPELASRPNSFDTDSVMLMVESLDPDSLTDATSMQSFDAEDYDDFTDWTEIYMDVTLQIDETEDTEEAVIRLTVSPTNSIGGALTMDAGSILISTPSLKFSSDGTF
ncbi:MAG: hypothetical protein PQJ61_07205 [Spirochaetales bacterium]|uniref:Uncharacterized protein n=1 Tax=Candidatus Thalassospirochaeta sargassi TaxID=3119039 RepID=A0AAJ1IHX7_9SPIO|nr:hypothetical protein [Spirochaetales bacterium]